MTSVAISRSKMATFPGTLSAWRRHYLSEKLA